MMILEWIAAKIFTRAAATVSGYFVDKATSLVEAFQKGTISKAEFEKEIAIAAERAAVDVHESTQATIRASARMQGAVSFVLYSQTLILLFYQIGPFLWPVLTAGDPFPEPVVTIEWAYLLIWAIAIGGVAVNRLKP